MMQGVGQDYLIALLPDKLLIGPYNMFRKMVHPWRCNHRYLLTYS